VTISLSGGSNDDLHAGLVHNSGFPELTWSLGAPDGSATLGMRFAQTCRTALTVLPL
jgi:hypothetical protein